MPFRTIALSAALACLLLPAHGLAASKAPASRRTLRVSGSGRVSVRPDVSVVYAGVEATGKDLAQTLSDASSAMRRVLSALAEAGIPERDVRTTRHDVQVLRAWKDGQPGEITGYAVSDEVRVIVRDLARLSDVLERVAGTGANSLRGLSFERDDPTPERREALARAVAQARAKAEAIAKASGVTLGDILEIAEAGESPPIPLERRGALVAASAEGTPVSPGELEIFAGVSVTWAIR